MDREAQAKLQQGVSAWEDMLYRNGKWRCCHALYLLCFLGHSVSSVCLAGNGALCRKENSALFAEF